jgi:predicted AlkP superfamily pyrophosphatase or phosphodiesterase
MTQPPLLCFLVDAVRHDYVSDETPFMQGLSSDGVARPLPTILGYSDSIRATAFTGLYPDELGYWMEYCFRPDTSPFGRWGSLGWLDRFPSDFVLRGSKYVASKTLMPQIARAKGYRSLDIRHIPFRALPFFDYTLREPMTEPQALPAPTIFDRLTSEGVGWTYVDSSKEKEEVWLERISSLRQDTKLVFVYLHHVDMSSHLFGVGSSRFHTSLRKVDALMAGVQKRVTARLGEPSILMFSDHGMSEVTSYVDLPKLLSHRAFGSRFCFALDGTMVRLWYLVDDPALREELRDYVAGRMPGRWLDDVAKKELHVSFPHRLYGDDIFLTEPGVTIFPNFHSYARPKGMHAYDPDDADQTGIIMASRGLAAAVPGSPKMVDIAQICMGALGVPFEGVAS